MSAVSGHTREPGIDLLSLLGVPVTFSEAETARFVIGHMRSIMHGYQSASQLQTMMGVRGITPTGDPANAYAWARATVARVWWAERARRRIVARAAREADAEFQRILSTPGTWMIRRDAARDARYAREAREDMERWRALLRIPAAQPEVSP